MLPTEAFSEVIAFLRLFDLKSLAVGNSLCSSLAVKASKMIRWEDLSGLRFHIYNKRFEVYRPTDAANKDDECGWQIVAFLTIANEKETTEFIDTAFPNCIFEDVGTTYFVSEQLLDAVGRVADAVVVKGVLSIDVLKRPDDSLSLVRKFRKVKALFPAGKVSDDQANEIAKLYRGSDIDEIHYCRSPDQSIPTKILLF